MSLPASPSAEEPAEAGRAHRAPPAHPAHQPASAPASPRALVDPPGRAARGATLPQTHRPADTLDPGPTLPRRRRGRGPDGVDPRPGEIPGLDGLRALAIVAVLLFHFLPTTLPGGFLGVDVFFVVSGFLITTLLLRELDARGRIDLPTFWRRRARRLLPALLLVVVTSVSVARLVGGDLLVGIGRQTVGALTFTSNWLEIAAGASYFHSTSPILFVNFWSLAVEEQFYLLWPLTLVVVLAATRTTRQRVLGVAGLGLASALLMATLVGPGQDATRVYYGTDTHLVGLMGGAALALAWADPRHRAGLRSRAWRRWRGTAVLGALLTLAALMRWTGEDSPLTFRGGIALASAATVVLVAGLLEAPSPWRRVMSARPLVWLGRRSYGIYLWHWPVLVIAGALVPYAPGTVRAALVLTAALVVTLVVSALSFTLVEQPVRRHGLRASGGRLARWLLVPWHESRAPRLVAAGLAVLLLGTIVALATAPDRSAAEQQIADAQDRIDAAGAEATITRAGPDLRRGTDLGLAAGIPDEAEDGDDPTADAAPEPEEKQDDGAQAARVPDAVEVRGSTFRPDEDGLLVPAGDQLTMIGDSLVVTSADGVTYRFPGTTYLAQSNRQWGDAAEIIADGLAAGTIRDNVVLHLGTNAGVDEEALRGALDALGPDRNVVVMDLYVQASFTEASNETIRRVVADYPGAVVGDWAETISGEPQVLQSDRIHPDIEGMHVYAEVVAEAFDTLARSG